MNTCVPGYISIIISSFQSPVSMPYRYVDVWLLNADMWISIFYTYNLWIEMINERFTSWKSIISSSLHFYRLRVIWPDVRTLKVVISINLYLTRTHAHSHTHTYILYSISYVYREKYQYQISFVNTDCMDKGINIAWSLSVSNFKYL